MSDVGSRMSLALSPRSARALAGALAALLAVGAGCFGPPLRTGSDARTVRIVDHELAAGESLESVADDYYGDEAAAGYLREVNSIPAGETPGPGDILEVPVGEPDLERYGRRTEAKAHYNRGTLCAGRGELGKAAEEFRSALRLDPRFADAGYNLGVTLLRFGDTAQAVSVLKQAAAVRRSDPEILYALGAALLESGRPEEALPVFENTIVLDPRHEDARFSRATTLLRLGRIDEAVFHLDAYVRDFPAGRWTSQARSELSSLGAVPEGDD